MAGNILSQRAPSQLGLPWTFPPGVNGVLLNLSPHAYRSMCGPGEAPAPNVHTHTVDARQATCERPFPGQPNSSASPEQSTLDCHMSQRCAALQCMRQVCSQCLPCPEPLPLHGALWHNGNGALQESYAKPTPLKVAKRTTARARPYAGQICQANLTPPSNLQQGDLVNQEMARYGHVCGECGKSFKFRSHLDRHLKAHTRKTPHACHLCPRKFAKKDNLLVHLRIHADVRPHVCRKCGKRFARASDLTTHIKRVHTPGAAPTICCEFCPQRMEPMKCTGNSSEGSWSSANQQEITIGLHPYERRLWGDGFTY